jgi:hypothetical protein
MVSSRCVHRHLTSLARHVRVSVVMYSVEPRQRQLGLGADSGVSTYYSSNIERPDVELVQWYLQVRGCTVVCSRQADWVRAQAGLSSVGVPRSRVR